MTSNNRKDGGAYRQYSRMVSLHAKPGKNRAKSRKKGKRRDKS